MATKERLKALEDMLAKDPGDIFTRYALALEQNGLGESDAATATLKEVIQRDPRYLAAYQQIGQIYYKRNNSREAKRYLRKGIEIAIEKNDIHAKQEMEEVLEEIEDEW